LILGAAGFGWQAPQGFATAQLRRLELIGHLAGLGLERSMRQASETWVRAPAHPGLETMPSAFFSLDAEFPITYVNVEGERVLRVSRDEVVGSVVCLLIADFETRA
jgi:PAS domain-containing protein